MAHQSAGEPALPCSDGGRTYAERPAAVASRDLSGLDTLERPAGWHFGRILGIALVGAFIASLILLTGDLATYWPLFLVPVALAALVYHTPGAILATASVVTAVVLLAYGLSTESPSVVQLTVGGLVIAVAGLVIGEQSGRRERQRRLLEMDALRDAGTGAYSRAYLIAQLVTESRRTQRYEAECSFALVGVVGMREYRRTFGRIKAERMMRRLAEVVQLAVRGTDVVGRWDDSSFGLVLPVAGRAEAMSVADRIVRAVEATEFEGDALEPVVHNAVVVGLAICPSEGRAPDSLVALAERRLDALLRLTVDTEGGRR